MSDSVKRMYAVLVELYGEDQACRHHSWLKAKIRDFSKAVPPDAAAHEDAGGVCARLAGHVFAIAYPDNVYDDHNPSIEVLGTFLHRHFEGIHGLHILPERLMCHEDVRPRDFSAFLPVGKGRELVDSLRVSGVLDEDLRPTDAFPAAREDILHRYGKEAADVVESAYNYHFNDGGFSQKDRSRVDPRFGTRKDIRALADRYALMLDFVANHVDIDNPELENFRRGKGEGSAFLVVKPEEYRRLRNNGSLSRTFRPRPFPLFTGLRKYADNENGSYGSLCASADAMNSLFAASGLPPLGIPLILYLSIAYAQANDQGLSAAEQRIFTAYREYCDTRGYNVGRLYADSDIQPGGLVFLPQYRDAPETAVVAAAGLSEVYARVFAENSDSVFGELFYIYTTFSESQADINPLGEDGFRLLFTDLFHILGTAPLAMLRMDAVKYLWKRPGERNFNMPEGDLLIELLRLVSAGVSPGTAPLDEINSPDADVYRMGCDGGLSYVFGQVNAVAVAFNEEDITPLCRYQEMMKNFRPAGLLPFVALATHDGRSVQGIGVQHNDGHVSIGQFCRLRRLIEDTGGKIKYRSVPPRSIPLETWDKAMTEAGADPRDARWERYFCFDADTVVLSDGNDLSEDPRDFLSLLAEITEDTRNDKKDIGRYLAEWIYKGKTPYELCCTSRAVFIPLENTGLEAARLLAAQLFVLTAGQYIPAVYFNDLLGLGNDSEGYKKSGQERDINRKKLSLNEAESLITEDPFTKVYAPAMNRLVSLRSKDPAFFPMSSCFDFAYFAGCVFMNHPFHKNSHSFIFGNISPHTVKIAVRLSDYTEEGALFRSFTDCLTGTLYKVHDDGTICLETGPFGCLWLKPSENAIS